MTVFAHSDSLGFRSASTRPRLADTLTPLKYDTWGQLTLGWLALILNN